MMKQIIFTLIAVCCLQLVCFSGCKRVDIQNYSGDGRIKEIGKWPFSKGYIISFDHFPLNENYENSFIVENIPQLNKTSYFGIKFNTDQFALEKIKYGKLGIKAQASDGLTYFDISEPIDNWRFSQSQINPQKSDCFIFYLDKNRGTFLSPEQLKSKKISLSVKLSGSEENPSITGEVVMITGGHK